MLKFGEGKGVRVKRDEAVPWVRNPSWSSLPSVSDTEQKLVGLRAIWPDDDNFCSFTVAGAYHIDWGDGTSEDVATGTQAYHTYSWSDADLANTNAPVSFTDATDLVSRTAHGYTDGMTISFASITSTTGITVDQIYYVVNATADTFQVASSRGGSALALTTNGSGWILPYKQALITITPQNGQNLTSIDLNKRHNQSGLDLYDTGWLDIIVSGPNLTALGVSGTTVIKNCLLERFQLISTNSIASLDSCFTQCSALASVLLKTSTSLTDTDNMFTACKSLQTIPLFDTSSVTTASTMFSTCYSLRTVPLFDFSSVTIMYQMFAYCASLESVPLFDTSSAMSMAFMFNGCSALQSVPLFDTSTVSSMTYMFSDCIALQEVPLFNTALVTDMSYMFNGCFSLRDAPLFNTSLVNTTSYMFNNCYALQNVPLFDTSSVISMANMFSNCSSLQNVPLFNTSSVTIMSAMFYYCTSLQSVPLFDTSAVTTMSQMFYYCYALRSIPLFDTSLVTTMSGAFRSCTNLQSIPALTATSVTAGALDYAFTTCGHLSRIEMTNIKYSFSVASCKLSGAALDEIYTNLPTVTGQTITVTGNYGAASDTPSIATAKGWTVTG